MKRYWIIALAALLFCSVLGAGIAWAESSGEQEYSTELRVEATPDHIVNYVTWYGNTEDNDLPTKMFPELTDDFQNDTITALYSSFPDDLKDNMVLIVVGDGMANKSSYDKMIDFYRRSAEECESLGLKFILQCVNGHTRPDWLIDLSVFEEFAKTYSCFVGINAAELYNGPKWRTDLWGEHSDYLADAIRTMAKYGCQVMWHDTNIFGDDGLFLDWLQGNENLYSAMKENYKNVTVMYKQSFSAPITESVIYGLWLNKMIGSFGIASDWWYRQINSVDGVYENVLWDEYLDDDPSKGQLNDTWEMIMNYPEAQYGQDMMKVLANGGTSFSQEAQYYSLSTYGTRHTAGEKVVYPLMREIEEGKLKIPTREEMLEKTQVAFVGKDAYVEVVHGNRVIAHETSGESLPTDGQYGLIPLLPKNLHLADKEFFESQGIRLIYTAQSEVFYDSLYEDKVLEGATAWATNVGDTWYFMNNSENKRNATQSAVLVPQVNSSESIGINLDGAAFGYLVESDDNLDFMVSNYVSSRKQFNYETDINIFPSGYYGFLNIYINYWFGVREQPDGRYGGAADDSLEEMGRPTVIRLEGQYQKPVLTFHDYEGSDSYRTPEYKYEEVYDKATHTYELTILQNGQVNFSIQTFGNPLDGKKVSVNGEQTSLLSDNDRATGLDVEAKDEIVLDLTDALDPMMRYRVTGLSFDTAVSCYVYTSEDGENYTLCTNLAAERPVCRYIRIVVNGNTHLSEIELNARKYLGNIQDSYERLLIKLQEAKSKIRSLYSEDTYAVLDDAIDYAESVIGDNAYEYFEAAYGGLERSLQELVRKEEQQPVTGLEMSMTQVELYVYGEKEKVIDVQSFSESAQNKKVSFEILEGEEFIEVVRENNFSYRITALEKGESIIRFKVDGTQVYTDVEVIVGYYPITNVAYKKTSVTVGDGQTWTDLLTDGKIDDRFTQPVMIDSIEEAVPENVRGRYYVIDLEEQYSLQYIKVYPYTVHKSIYGLIVLASNDLSFTGDYLTVYNADKDNVHGFGAGTDEDFYYGARIDIEDLGQKYRYILVTGLGNGWHCQGADPVWPYGNVQLVEVEVFAEIVNEDAIGEVDENVQALQRLVNEERAKNLSKEDYEPYTYKMYNSALLRAEVVLDEYDRGVNYNAYDFYNCIEQIRTWSTKLINISAANAVKAKIDALDVSYFDPYAYENFENEVYGYFRALRVPTRIYDENFKLVVDDVTMDYRPLLNEGFTDAYVATKQAEVDEIAVRMQNALDNLYVESVNELLIGLGKPTIEKKEQILRVIDAYDALSDEQKARVEYVSILESAQKVIRDAETKQIVLISCIVVGAVLLAAGAAVVTIILLKKRKIKEGK